MLNSKNVNTNQKGFTLIELVVVIVILGILAVTAAPKFINVQDDAKTATIEGVRAAINSASALVHSKSLIAGDQDKPATDSPSVIIDASGTTVNTNYGYPTNEASTNSWDELLELNEDDFTSVKITSTAGTVYFVVYRADDTAPVITVDPTGDGAADAIATAKCYAWYTSPAALNDVPTSGSVDCQVTP